MRPNSRIIRTEEKRTKLSLKGNHDDLVDEIALRDEILELKRQVVILKRTNEQNLIKFRKYEDEAKRKDRQIEELMDPRKNADITKLLSVKGAAILMNLKDQNNSLIQMILNKDLQIRRLVAEIKTSKLYSASKKTENYRTEINRLRTLLEKSRESLKESIDLQQQQQKLICINGNSTMQTSSSSEQSSPRELEDLRFTIQSLETHIKYSNDLLAKKNLEILTLNDELNSLRKVSQCKTCRKFARLNEINDNIKSSEKIEVLETPQLHLLKSTIKSEKAACFSANSEGEKKISELFEKTMRLAEDEKKSNSAPASSLRCSSFSDQSFDHEFMDFKGEKRTVSKNDNEIFDKISNSSENFEMDSRKNYQNKMVSETLSKDDDENKIRKEEKKRRIKKIWIKSFVTTKQFKRKCTKKNSVIRKKGRKKIKSPVNKKKKEISDLKLEKMKKKIEDNYEGKENDLRKKGSDNISHLDFEKLKVEQEVSNNSEELKYVTQEEVKENSYVKLSETLQAFENTYKTFSEECQIPTENLKRNGHENNEKNENMDKTEKETADDSTGLIKKEITNIAQNFSPEIQRELKNLYENITIYEEIEMKKVKARREIYKQNFDSSFDSDNGYLSKQEPRSVQVEVEINSLPFSSDDFESPRTPIKNIKLVESYSFETNMEGNDFNDDDDVIIL